MAYSVVTWTSGGILSKTNLDQVNANFLYLLNRPSQSIKRNNGAAYAIGVAAMADIDSTNLIITLAMAGTAVLVCFNGVTLQGGTQLPYLDFVVDGVRFANSTYGIQGQSGVGSQPNYTLLVTGITPGTRVFKPQWQGLAAGTTMQAQTTTSLVFFSVVEVA